ASIESLAARLFETLQTANALIGDTTRATEGKALVAHARALHSHLDERLQVAPAAHWSAVLHISDELKAGIVWLEALAALSPATMTTIT
ncbi:MAG TPA: hypothetical protein VF147_03610, partial [Vicinamibacterales bacterium]